MISAATDNALGLILTAVTVAYLLFVLFRPERF